VALSFLEADKISFQEMGWPSFDRGDKRNVALMWITIWGYAQEKNMFQPVVGT